MPSRIRPRVKLFFPCDDANLDLADMKWRLTNPWHTVQMPPGVKRKFVLKQMWLYAHLTGGVGKYSLGVEMAQFDPESRRGQVEQLVRGLSEPGPAYEFLDPYQIVEAVFEMKQIPFPKPNTYVFRLFVDGEPLDGGIFDLRVLAGDDR